MQAIVAGIATAAVYFAATIPVRAEARSRERERSLRAQGMALLLLPEIIVLKGEIETYIESVIFTTHHWRCWAVGALEYTFALFSRNGIAVRA
jgi:hypothetical protein